MFVVPLYAFLTTTGAKSQTARTVAANNIVNSGFMVAATLVLSLLIGLGLTIDDTLLMVAAMCLLSAWLAWKLHKACDCGRFSFPLDGGRIRSEEHTSELQSLMRNSYAVFCLKRNTRHVHSNTT